MLTPQKRSEIEYERVKVDDWINGTIVDIQYEAEHKSSYKGEEKIYPAVRFKFDLEGCEFAKYSRWMYFGYGEKTNLFKKYLSNILEDMKPDTEYDIYNLKGLKVKTMWANTISKSGDVYQHIEMIRAIEKLKYIATEVPLSDGDSGTDANNEDSCPF